MKYIAVDVGNSDIKIATIDGEIGEIERSPTSNVDMVAEEVAQRNLPVALCAVRPGAAEKFKSALNRYDGSLLLEVNRTITRPVSGFYEGMGADRIADVAGARALYGRDRAIAVVGLGTGTTITTIDADGVFSGGLTTLGLGPICKTITEALPALPPIDPRTVVDVIPGFDVYSALCHGTVAAHVGLVEYWVKIFKDQLGQDLVIVATGGWSELIGKFTSSINHVNPLLTFEGIQSIVSCLE